MGGGVEAEGGGGDKRGYWEVKRVEVQVYV
jgi:hypothetical protein